MLSIRIFESPMPDRNQECSEEKQALGRDQRGCRQKIVTEVTAAGATSYFTDVEGAAKQAA